MIRIRRMVANDAEAASSTLIASITGLCAADHGDDPARIRAWTANKSPDAILRWIENPNVVLVMAVTEGACAGIGGASKDGNILLNYVHPDHRFRGVSRSILRHLEGELLRLGHTAARLTSTKTALRFYLSAGWRETGETDRAFGVDVHPMIKALVAAP